MVLRHLTTLTALILFSIITTAARAQQWVTYEGGEGPGKGKHIVLVSGDEEYRSEEALPQLGKILAQHHGFRCTVLFAIDPKSGIINPNVQTNIPGLEALADADLMIVFLRFRRLPDDQMKHIDAYLRSGRPVVGLRTSTHAFNFGGKGQFARYGNGYGGDAKEWRDGFGRLVLGEKWISHHGRHKQQSTRGKFADGAEKHPILRGITDGAIWGPTDVYGVRLPLPGDSQPLVLGQVVNRKGKFDGSDPFFGMKESDTEPSTDRNDPMMPVAWTKSFQVPGGKEGRSFTSTIGSSTDLVNDATRRLVINGSLWCLKMEDQIPAKGLKVDIVGEYKPTAYSFHNAEYWAKKAMKVSDHELQ
ncbi:MAG: ThuA domain-containing protein [Pirellulaceae bacterium]|jgi:hypothetical protein|nr:ThuA domain-containing protein [Pirellulaceae bacterium]MDP7018396.1 ThuA domain-containing protein [Pirellulaceae bacterium]